MGVHLTPDNVRLAHKVCNARDYGWRKKINAMLGKQMSLEAIAEKLNAEKVPTIHGTNRWTAASVRKASCPRGALGGQPLENHGNRFQRANTPLRTRGIDGHSKLGTTRHHRGREM